MNSNPKARGSFRIGRGVGLLAAAAVVAVILFGDRGLWSLLKLHQEKRDLVREVERLRTGIESLRAEYREYGASPAAVERAAREELNLLKPGELVYKFGPPQ